MGKKNIIAGLMEEYDIETADDIQEALKDLLGGTINFSADVRKVIYTTNAIESLNSPTKNHMPAGTSYVALTCGFQMISFIGSYRRSPPAD